MSYSGWRKNRIEELCTIKRGASPRPIIDYIVDDGIPWVKISDATSSSSRYINKTEEFIKEEGKNKSRFIKKGTLILSNSATPGIPKVMGIDACVHDGWLIVDDFKNVTKEYLYYVFINERERLLNLSNGSVFRNLKTDIVKKYEISVPSIYEQNKIVQILESLDNKIELNNEMNKTLEEMAQALFKRWFVDFEFPNQDGKPYKSSGGEMVESEMGMIPKGWNVKKIKDIGEVVAGGTPSTKIEEYYDGDIPWITPKDLSGYDRKFISKGERSITSLGLEKSSAKLMKKGTVLFSSRAPIGYIVIAENEVTTNQGFKSIVCDENVINNNYVYHYLKYNKEKIENVASGSTFKEVSGTTMKMLNIIVPSIDILNRFKDIMDSYDQVLKSNYIENDYLVDIRDSLLPKLMSGEIRVNDMEANL